MWAKQKTSQSSSTFFFPLFLFPIVIGSRKREIEGRRRRGRKEMSIISLVISDDPDTTRISNDRRQQQYNEYLPFTLIYSR